MTDLIDSWDETHTNGQVNLSALFPSVQLCAAGQSFLNAGTIHKITSAKFWMKKLGSPTGMAHAVLYEIAGTYGTDSIPTGAALATSDDFDVESLTTSFALYTFTFTGVQQFAMQDNTHYCIVVQAPTVGFASGFNYAAVARGANDRAGNLCYYADGWKADALDAIFYVYGDVIASLYLTRIVMQTRGLT